MFVHGVEGKLCPWAPLNKERFPFLFGAAQLSNKSVFYDLGCGKGEVLVAAAKKFGCRVVGVDIEENLIQDARTAAKEAGVDHLCEWVTSDFRRVNLAEGGELDGVVLPKPTVVMMWLLPQVMDVLEDWLWEEWRKAALSDGGRGILSLQPHHYHGFRWIGGFRFAFPDWSAQFFTNMDGTEAKYDNDNDRLLDGMSPSPTGGWKHDWPMDIGYGKYGMFAIKKCADGATMLLDALRRDNLGVGEKCECRHGGGPQFFPAMISALHPDGTYDVAYDDGDAEQKVLRRRIGRANEKQSRYLVIGECVDAHHGGGTLLFAGRISAAHDDGTYGIAYDDGDREIQVHRKLILAQKWPQPKNENKQKQ